MRTLDPALVSALASGAGRPSLRGFIGYADGSVKHTQDILRYRLTGQELEFEMAYQADLARDQEQIWLERGVTHAGSTYRLATGRFFIHSQRYLPDGRQVARGALFPREYYAAPGDDTYRNVITAFCARFGKTAVFRDPSAAWLGYQFLPDGKQVVLNDPNAFAGLLRQKYLIFYCDNGEEEVLFYSCDGSLNVPADATLAAAADLYKEMSHTRNRCFLWRDESGSLHTDGDPADPLHHLGYLESTALPPARHTPGLLMQARTRPDLRLQDGDVVAVDALGVTSKMFALVAEEYAAPGSSHPHPRWETVLTSHEVFGNTAGGALPSTIERVSNYTPLNTSSFNGLLTPGENNLQAAMDRIDDRALASYSNVLGANGLNGTLAAGATLYLAPFVSGLQADANIRCNFPRAGTAQGLRVRIDSAQPGSGSLVVTLMIAGNPSSIVVTIPAGSLTGVYADTLDTEPLSAGQALSFRIKNNAASASAKINGVSIDIAGLR